MRRLVGVALLALVAGCTSVKMVQRDGCWVRRTEKAFGRVVEEVGPCAKVQTPWAQDRLTRLVQECMVDADYRWHARALETWARRAPYATPQPQKEEVLTACMQEARTGMAAETEMAALREKLNAVASERDGLRHDAERDRAKVQESQDRLQQSQEKLATRLLDSQDKLSDRLQDGNLKLADWLGQAALKPPGNASATATSNSTSDGKATNDSGTTLSAESGASAPPPGAPVSNASVVVPAAPGASDSAPVVTPAATAKRAKLARARRGPPVVQATQAASCAPQAGGVPPCAAGTDAPKP